MSKTQVASTKPRPRSLWIRRLLNSFITTSPHVSIDPVISCRLRGRALTQQCVHVTVASHGTQQDLQWGCHGKPCACHTQKRLPAPGVLPRQPWERPGLRPGPGCQKVLESLTHVTFHRVHGGRFMDE